jgi:hypothetical protein
MALQDMQGKPDASAEIILARLALIERRLTSIERLLTGISHWVLRPTGIRSIRSIGHVDEDGVVHWDAPQ